MQMEILNKNNYHLLGIGGIGISAIAKMLQMQGKKVTGSDASQSEITDELEKSGVKVFIGQKAENIPNDTEVVIYTVAITDDNPELKEARNKNIVCKTYPEALGELSKHMFTIAISGTHGKTTTTAMIGHILEKAMVDPTIIVGSKMMGEDGKYSNFHAGKSKYLVVEACEYKRSFLNLSPKILVITNIEADHLDYYKDLDDIKSAFEELEEKVPADGFVITENEYREISDEDIKLLVPGKHNISNAKAAIKAVEKVGVSSSDAKRFLADFKGTWRRQEYRGEKDGNIFYDDYAHHPTEIRATLSALKEKHPDRKLVAVFEPHQELRTKLLFDHFVESLKIADQVFIAPIYINKEKSDGSVTNQTLADAINKQTPASAVDNPEELMGKITPLNSNLCIAMLGAGNIYKWTKEILSD